jgi:hypothetical protein
MAWYDFATDFARWVGGPTKVTPNPILKGPKKNSELDLPVAEDGLAMPVLFGTRKLNIPNVVWWGDLKTASLGDDKFKYYLGMHLALCHGPIDYLRKVLVGDKEIYSGYYEGGSLYVNLENLFGGVEKEGGVVGSFDVDFGESAQLQNTYLQSVLNDQTPAFRGVVGIVLNKMYLGTTPYFKPWSFLAQRIHTVSSGETQWYDEKAEVPLRIVDEGNNIAGTNSKLNWTPGLYNIPIRNVKESDIITITKQIGGTYQAWSPFSIGAFYTNQFTVHDFLGNETTYWDQYSLTENAAETYASNNPIELTGSTQYDIWLLNPTGSLGGERGGLSINYEIKAASPSTNPAHIIRECLTNPDWGMGYQSADIDETSFTNAADVMSNEEMGVSLLWQDEVSIKDFVSDVLRHIDASLYYSRSTGKFVLKLIRDDYDINTVPSFDESNVKSIKNLKQNYFGNAVNSVTVNYWDSITEENASVTAQDTALIISQNEIINTTIEYDGFTTGELASRVASRDLKALSAPVWNCEIVTNKDAFDLNRGDVIKFSWSEYKLVNLAMRVVGISFGDGKNNAITVKLIEDVFSLPQQGSISTPPPSDGWQPIDQTPTIVPVRVPQEAPYYKLAEVYTQSLINATLASDPSTGYFVAAGTEPTAEAAVYAKVMLDFGSGFIESKTMYFSPSAELTSNIAKTDELLTITNANNIDLVSPGQFAQIGNELLKVISVTETTLTVGRAVLDTVPENHLAGDTVVFWDGFGAFDSSNFNDPNSVDCKLLTVTGSEILTEAEAPTDSVVFSSRAFRPYPPGLFAIDGVRYSNQINLGVSTVSWAHRNRQTEVNGNLIDDSAGNNGPEAGTTYTIRLYNALDVLQVEYTGLTGTSKVIPIFEFITIGEVGKIVLFSKRDGYESTQSIEHSFTYNPTDSGYGYNYGESYGG